MLFGYLSQILIQLAECAGKTLLISNIQGEVFP